MRLPDPTKLLGDPWTARFVLIMTVGLAVATIVLGMKVGGIVLLGALPALGAVILGALAYNRMWQAGAEAKPPFPLIIAAYGLAVVGLTIFGRASGMFGWGIAFVSFGLFMAVLRASGVFRNFVVLPLLFGCVPLLTAAILGKPTVGGFPAALALLYAVVLSMTRQIEQGTAVPETADDHPPVHHVHRLALARISIVFFVFGVVSLWPWLGKLYGAGYFWVLLIGVLLPATLYWGRLRQPRDESSYEALVRFNRLSPYLGGMLLLAFLVS